MKKGEPTASDSHVNAPLGGPIKRKRWTHMQVKEVSLVENPANPLAKVVLHKQHTSVNSDIIGSEKNLFSNRGELSTMNVEELAKQLKEQASQIEALQKENAKMKEESEKARGKKAKEEDDDDDKKPEKRRKMRTTTETLEYEKKRGKEEDDDDDDESEKRRKSRKARKEDDDYNKARGGKKPQAGENDDDDDEEDDVNDNDDHVSGEKRRKARKSMDSDYIETIIQKALSPVMKANQALMKQVETLVDEREMYQLQKMAETEFPNYPGSAEDKAKLLKSINALPKEQREVMLENMRKQDVILSKSFGELGSGSPALSTDSSTSLETMAKSYAQKEGVTYEQAYAKMLQTPEGRKLYEQNENEMARKRLRAV